MGVFVEVMLKIELSAFSNCNISLCVLIGRSKHNIFKKVIADKVKFAAKFVRSQGLGTTGLMRYFFIQYLTTSSPHISCVIFTWYVSRVSFLRGLKKF